MNILPFLSRGRWGGRCKRPDTYKATKMGVICRVVYSSVLLLQGRDLLAVVSFERMYIAEEFHPVWKVCGVSTGLPRCARRDKRRSLGCIDSEQFKVSKLHNFSSLSLTLCADGTIASSFFLFFFFSHALCPDMGSWRRWGGRADNMALAPIGPILYG